MRLQSASSLASQLVLQQHFANPTLILTICVMVKRGGDSHFPLCLITLTRNRQPDKALGKVLPA